MIGNTIINLETVDSTNLYLNKLLKTRKNIDEGTVVITKQQVAGRGQLNNIWESNPGENLLISYIVFPFFLKADHQFILSKATALGVFDFLSGYLEKVKIKWPNDIYVNDKKICGILIENSLRGASISNSIIGIGININQSNFSKKIPNPTSLKLETQRTFDLQKTLTALCEKLDNRYEQIKSAEYEDVNNLYINHLYRYNIFSNYRDKSGIFSAKITGIDESGRLCLCDSSNNFRKYAFKEVEFI